jgi:hypothetical protein
MRRILRSLGAPVAAIAIAATWGALPAGADTTRVVHPGQSIQVAVDASKPGDTIIVQPGTYAENVEIHKNDLHLYGRGATIVPPAAPHAGSVCADPSDPTSWSGFCVIAPGSDFVNGVVASYLKGTEIRGFTVKGFGGNGFIAFGAQDTEVTRNSFLDNGEYGAAAFTSKQTTFEHNVSKHTGEGGEAGFYIGDSPTAHAQLDHNVSSGYTFGIFERDAFGVHAEHNNLYGNCVGAISLADAPGPAGHLVLDDNYIHDNTKFCPPEPGDEPPISVSGVGVASAGGTDNHVHENRIVGNVPSQPADLTGGILVITGGPGGTPPTHNHMTSNIVKNNGVDIFWDGTGSDNLFFDNHCRTSAVDPNLCKK